MAMVYSLCYMQWNLSNVGISYLWSLEMTITSTRLTTRRNRYMVWLLTQDATWCSRAFETEIQAIRAIQEFQLNPIYIRMLLTEIIEEYAKL